MLDQDKKISYKESEDMINEILNIQDSYKSVCKTWCKWLKREDLGISLYSFRIYYWDMIEKVKHPSTVNATLVMMKKRILYLFDKTNNIIDAKAMLEYKMKVFKAPPKVNKSISQEKIFSDGEINKLLSLSGVRTSLIIEFLHITGCRRQELCDVLISKCTKRKDKIDIGIYGKGTKYRVVWISKDLYKRINKIFHGKKYLFETLSGIQFSGHSIWDMVKFAGKKHLNRKLSPHMLRHSFGTKMLSEGHPDKAIADYMGHSSTETLHDNYAHQELDHKKILGGVKNK
jgi:integrase